ncbi:hypothetical protein Tco_0465906 [Tanacetum coccineum]
MITYLKNMEGWKHKDLKSKDFDSIKEPFDKAFTRVNMFVDFRTELVDGSLKRVGEELEQESTKKQKVDKDKDTAELQSLIEVIPDEEEVAIDVVPLATKSLSIVDWKIHKERKKISNRMIYMLVEKRYSLTLPTIIDLLNKKLQGRIIGIKSLLNAASIIAALIDGNAAQSKLVLLENFNENYSVFKTADEVTTTSTKLLLLEEVTTT